MRRYNFFISVFEKAFKRGEVFTVNKSSKAYEFFSNEYPKEYCRDLNGNYIVKNTDEGKDTYKKVSDPFPSRKVDLGSDSYSYFMSEYRQNSPTTDIFGNFLLNDEIVKTKTR